jgi:site-specific recombinase XerD
MPQPGSSATLRHTMATFLNETAALRDHSKRTTSSYRNRLQTFVDFLGDPEIDVAVALVQSNTVRYFHWLNAQDLEPTTTYAKKQIMVAFWNWAYRKGFTSQRLETRLKKPPKPPVVYLTPDEAARIERAALAGTNSRSILHLRDQAAFALLNETEMSLQALSNLPAGAYNPTARTLAVGAVTVLLGDHLCGLLDRYLQARRFQRKPGRRLLVAYTGNAWSSQSIRKAVQRHRRAAGLPQLIDGQRTHPRHWSEEERERFSTCTVEPYDRAVERAQLVVALGLHCGLRRGEMTILKAGDVDLFHKQIHVLGKGQKRRQVPLNGHVLSILEPIVRARRPDQTLLIGKDGGSIDEERINDVVSALAERTGITYKTVTPHTLRHSFASRLSEQGVDLVTIKELMGHGRIEETIRYLHPAERSKRDAVERLVRGDDSDGKVPS